MGAEGERRGRRSGGKERERGGTDQQGVGRLASLL